MSACLRILHLEDSLTDAELIRECLLAGGLECDVLRVENRADFTGLLRQARFDLVLADYALPSFDGASALALARDCCPALPFIFVSGTLGEEVAIETLKSGATDYVLKSRLSRLVPAVHRALAEAKQRAELKRAEAAMFQSEHKYRHLFECLADAAFLLDPDTGRILDANKQAELLLGLARGEIIGSPRSRWFPLALQPVHPATSGDGLTPRLTLEGLVVRQDGSKVPVLIGTSSVTLHGKALQLELMRDITERKRVEAALMKSEEAMRHLSVRILQSQDEERRRIARELHDNTAQNLAALGMNLSLLEQLVRPEEVRARALLADCRQLAEQSSQELRTFSYLLHPPMLEMLGLPGALAEYLEGFSNRSGIRVEFNPPPDFGRLPEPLETGLFRVVQEGLANIRRHSGSSTATVLLQRDHTGLRLEVADAGRGIPPDRLAALALGSGDLGVGIPGMQQRLRELGGRLEIESGERGTRVRAILREPGTP